MQLNLLLLISFPLVMNAPTERNMVKHSACRHVKADIVMLLDDSGSVTLRNFRKLKDFASSVANAFTISPSDVNMAVVTFSTNVHDQFDLNSYQSSSSLLDAISKIPYSEGLTNTYKAINYLVNHSFTSGAGDRPDAPNIAVVITDGRSQNKSLTLAEAKALHNADIKTLAIGIGNSIDIQELNAIASSQNLVFKVPTFDVLHTIQGFVDSSICEGNVTQPSAQPVTQTLV